MNRLQLIQICDLLVLTVIVGVFARFSWVAAVVVAVLGVWLGLVRTARRNRANPMQNSALSAGARRSRHEWVWDPLDPINRHWHW